MITRASRALDRRKNGGVEAGGFVNEGGRGRPVVEVGRL